jgi:hypothetical protein
MPNPCEIVYGYASAVDSVVVQENAIANDVPTTIISRVIVGFAMLLSSSAMASDLVTVDTYVPIVESATATDTVYPSSSGGVVIARDSARAEDQSYPSTLNVITESATATGSVVLSQIEIARESAAAASQVSPSALPVIVLIGSARATDKVYIGTLNVLTDSATASDTVYSASLSIGICASSATATDSVEIHAPATVIVREAASASDGVIIAASTTVIVMDSATAVDAVVFDDAPGFGWVASTDTFAMSRYDNFPFNSLAVVDGQLLGLTATGAFQLIGKDDSGAQIDAEIDMGMTDLTDGKIKRDSYVYFGYQCTGTLEFLVGNTQDGIEKTYIYDLPKRVATDPVPGRARLGRGMKTRYHRFGIRNKNGAGFGIFDIRVPFDDTSRKV